MVGGTRFVRCVARVAALIAALSMTPAFADNAGEEAPLTLVLNQAKLVKLPERAATIVIGNPLIADAALQPGGLIVMTAKGYGTTNLIALDRRGNALMEKRVQVRGAEAGNVVVYKGVNRETYNCTQACQPTNTLGDSQQFFAQTLADTVARNTQALSMSGAK